MWILIPLLVGIEALLTLATSYLLGLLLAAALRKRKRNPAEASVHHTRFVILIPAHDEELGIGNTLASLHRLDYPKTNYEIVVIADNCRDHTAELAREAGATVYERYDLELRGKGYALAWALDRLFRDKPKAEAIVLLDADCEVSPNLLAEIDTWLRTGARAIQTNNAVANPEESWSSALRFAAFSLINTVNPMGKSALGLSCGLKGTGMAFTRELLEQRPWDSYSLAEDGEYYLQLVADGIRVVFAPEATVRSAMPTSLRQSREQQLRWEGGRWELARQWIPRLVRAGLHKRDLACLVTCLELLVPPQSLLVMSNTALLVVSTALHSGIGIKLALINIAGQACYIAGGLILTQAPVKVYKALALAPVLIAWKAGLYARILVGRGPTGWVRTVRKPE